MTCYPYNQYAGHFVLGVIYTKSEDVADEHNNFGWAGLNIQIGRPREDSLSH
jgi:Restriction endonuclease EcoRV